eukprot:GDKH01008977.1.p1 GENE.GDKH01008977.1~~GDKH01008977.1.p1  ORF type:complete len:54 (-),score=2.87 GDKH01008977.1:64-225(-)
MILAAVHYYEAQWHDTSALLVAVIAGERRATWRLSTEFVRILPVVGFRSAALA